VTVRTSSAASHCSTAPRSPRQLLLTLHRPSTNVRNQKARGYASYEDARPQEVPPPICPRLSRPCCRIDEWIQRIHAEQPVFPWCGAACRLDLECHQSEPCEDAEAPRREKHGHADWPSHLVRLSCRSAAVAIDVTRSFTSPYYRPSNTEITCEAPSPAPASSGSSHCWAAHLAP